MRILHNQSAVSGEHDGASRFLQLRGQTRKNALIYTNTLLPKTDDVVKRIKEYAFEIRVSDFEEWHEGLEDITEEVIKAEKACNFLMHLHDNLIVELKKNEDDAMVAITDLDKLKAMYEADKENLLSAATEHRKNKEWLEKLGLILAIPTFGIGTWVAHAKANQEQREINKNLAKATASRKNGEITQEAVNLTEESLIPAIKNFLKGLKACSDFLTATREHLSKLSERGRQGQEDAKMRYFRLMKKHANELESNCMMFITSSSEIRTNLKAIPLEPSDKNYVDEWLACQLAEFKNSNSCKIGSVMNFLKLGFLQEVQGSPGTVVRKLNPPTTAFDALEIEQGTLVLDEIEQPQMRKQTQMAKTLNEIDNID